MGQPIMLEGKATLGDVSIFEMNRSITGQVGESYENPSDADLSVTLPGRLAARLFEVDPGIDHVHVAGSSVSVRRPEGWPEDSLVSAEKEIRNFFIHWDENRA